MKNEASNSDTSASKDKKLAEVKKSEFRWHKVKAGESMYSISKKYGVEAQTIKDLNKMKNNNLKPGQVIKLPK